jgi:hypothetical protein
MFIEMTKKVDYKKEYKKRIEYNLGQVLKELNDESMSYKISNWANKFSRSFDEIKQKIEEDEIFRCVFIKEPGRQSFHEQLAAKYIQSLENVTNFKKMPNRGKDAIYFSNGKIFKGSDLHKKHKDTKSADFMWKTGKFTFYATHKYTDINGGGQDSQYDEIYKFLKNTLDCNEKNCIVLAICDGEYYQRKDSKTGDATKLKRLERLTNNKTVFVKTIEELDSFLKQFL